MNWSSPQHGRGQILPTCRRVCYTATLLAKPYLQDPVYLGAFFAVSIAQTFLIIPHSRDPRSFKYNTKCPPYYHQALWSGHQGGAKSWYNYRCSENILARGGIIWLHI